ncbi:MAG: hypothetical protein MUE33_01735 [Cytophagaceae bacterium]|jgi:hypothetical protein|nr:hypothetical protein [Cytophagaceae bacterium]
MNRLEQLLEIEKNEPGDPFILYGIALEYVAIRDQRASQYFETLLQEHADYLPTYYVAAGYFSETDTARALSIYRMGIVLAEKKQDVKTLAELKNALLNLELEE